MPKIPYAQLHLLQCLSPLTRKGDTIYTFGIDSWGKAMTMRQFKHMIEHTYINTGQAEVIRYGRQEFSLY